jgi:hypothetical protein
MLRVVVDRHKTKSVTKSVSKAHAFVEIGGLCVLALAAVVYACASSPLAVLKRL